MNSVLSSKASSLEGGQVLGVHYMWWSFWRGANRWSTVRIDFDFFAFVVIGSLSKENETMSTKNSPLFPYEPLTAEQVVMMNDFAAKVDALPEISPMLFGLYQRNRDVFLVKFLTARKWNIADALKMVVDTTEFRKKRQLDVTPLFPPAIKCHGYDIEALVDLGTLGPRAPSELDRYSNQLKSCYASSWHKWDKGGRPVYIERTGRINVKEIVRRCKQMVPPGNDFSEPCVVAHLHANEVGGALLRYKNETRAAGTPEIVQVTVVMDCKGFSLGHLFGPAMDILKAQSVMDQAYYPEGLHKLYVANAPTSLSVAWNIVKGWLDARVQKKIVFMKSGETAAGLLEAIDADKLPLFLGGTCKCEGGCVGSDNPTEEIEDDDAMIADNVVKTELIKVPARDKVTKSIAVDEKTQTLWDFHVEDKLDISISATFEGADGSNVVIADAERLQKGSGQYSTKTKGTIVISLDNTFSWLAKKTVCFLAVTTVIENE